MTDCKSVIPNTLRSLSSATFMGPGRLPNAPGSSLWKRRRHGRVEHDVPFGLLHDLVDVSVEHRHRSESLEITESLFAILSSPAPFGINRPQRNVCEYHLWIPKTPSGLKMRVFALFVKSKPASKFSHM